MSVMERLVKKLALYKSRRQCDRVVKQIRQLTKETCKLGDTFPLDSPTSSEPLGDILEVVTKMNDSQGDAVQETADGYTTIASIAWGWVNRLEDKQLFTPKKRAMLCMQLLNIKHRSERIVFELKTLQNRRKQVRVVGEYFNE